jgi:hypothetical protein
MTNHDYLVVCMAILWLATNCLGAAFTLRRLYHRWNEKGIDSKYPFDMIPIALIRPLAEMLHNLLKWD